MEQDKNGKFFHYDYGSGFRGHEFKKIHENSKNASKIFYKFCEENNFSKEDISNFSIQILNKLKSVEQAVNDKKFISAILLKTNFQPLDELERVDNTREIVKKIKRYFNKRNISFF